LYSKPLQVLASHMAVLLLCSHMAFTQLSVVHVLPSLHPPVLMQQSPPAQQMKLLQ